MKAQLTAVFQQVPEGYIGFVEELPGANAQGDSLEEARSNLQEAVQLVLEANRALIKETLRDKTVIRETFCSNFMKRVDPPVLPKWSFSAN
jgi:predicted RNase H-like HicB family nuclease